MTTIADIVAKAVEAVEAIKANERARIMADIEDNDPNLQDGPTLDEEE